MGAADTTLGNLLVDRRSENRPTDYRREGPCTGLRHSTESTRYTNSKAGRMAAPSTAPWRRSEYAVAYALKHRGVRCRNIGAQLKSWDIETENGVRIDVKDSLLTNGRWVVNLRRRRQKKHPDFYVVALRGLNGPHGETHRAFVILDAKDYPTQTVLIWTVRSLISKHATECGDWNAILQEEQRREGTITAGN